MIYLKAVRVDLWFAGQIKIGWKRDISYTSRKQLANLREFVINPWIMVKGRSKNIDSLFRLFRELRSSNNIQIMGKVEVLHQLGLTVQCLLFTFWVNQNFPSVEERVVQFAKLSETHDEHSQALREVSFETDETLT